MSRLYRIPPDVEAETAALVARLNDSSLPDLELEMRDPRKLAVSYQSCVVSDMVVRRRVLAGLPESG